MTKMLAGSYLEDQIVPNITPDKATGIGNWTEQQIATLLKTGVKPDGSHVKGLMAGIVGPPGFADLTNEDVTAIAAYVKTIPAVNNVPQAPAAPAQAAAAQAATPAAGTTAAATPAGMAQAALYVALTSAEYQVIH
jgi:mono/diheme cytochrome c family protein